ncbi:hypothetical protein [Massilia sp. TS11]|uniref:hypothetical protein n=1 Tax=Massilia sp. TS11 TaxID=2908003 RepID=UPI001EDB3DD8|nr:hypothetical protein [Massilia sp. TS11]MCG2583904.1 hypothetical protein [Massilia sp. TS11]
MGSSLSFTRSDNTPVPPWASALFSRRVAFLPKVTAVLLADDELQVDWTEEEVVYLHWRLLCEVDALAEPTASLDEKIDLLRWVFTDSERDARPFSFANCLRVVACSPFSPLAYLGAIDVDEVRGWLRGQVRHWLRATFAAYPVWVQAAIAANPGWIAERLARNPQCLNEAMRVGRRQADLFA